MKNSRAQNTLVIPRNARHTFILASIGMSFLWPFLREYSFFGLILPRSSSSGTSNPYFIVYLTVIVLTAMICVILRSHIIGLIRYHRWIVPFVATVSTLGILGILILRDTWMADTVSYAAMIVLALCFIASLFAWSDFLLSDTLDPKAAMVCVTLSFVLSAIIGYLVYLPWPFNYIRPLAIPVASGWLWYAVSYAPVSNDERTGRVLFDHHGDRDLFWPIVLMFVFIVGASFIVGTYSNGIVNLDLTPINIYSITSILVFGLILLAFLIRSSDAEKTIYIIWVGISALLIVSIIVTSVANLGIRRYFQITTFSGYIFTEFFLYLILITCLRRRSYPCVLTISCFFIAPVVIARVIIYCVVPALVVGSGHSFDEIYNSLALTIASVLILCVFFFMGLMILIPASRGAAGSGVLGSDDGSAGPSRDNDEVFSALATRYGLSQREADVLRVLSQGHTFSKAAEELLLSESTVQAHAKSLYRKLDVHSKQELIDLVDAEAAKAK